MWFIVLMASVHGIDRREIGDGMVGFRFKTQAGCLADASRRAEALKSVNIHGRFLCMYHGEPDRELRHAVKFAF